jgi:cell division protein FtsB
MGVTRVGPPARPGDKTSSGGTQKPRPAIAAAPARGSLAAVLSWRTLVLAGVLGLAFALVWPSLRVYNDQRAQNAELRAERDAAQAEVDDLEAQLARWQDPAFVVAQARERLAYVFPGETPYRVVDPEVARPAAEGSAEGDAEGGVTQTGPWFETLWSSVEAAGSVVTPAAASTVPEGAPPSTEPAGPTTNVELGG